MTPAIGLVGCGRWGRLVLRDLAELGCSVSVVARSGAGVANAREGGAATIVPSVAELPEVAGVVVVTPTRAHVETVDAALDRGVPVFVEKPMASDPAAADRLAAAAGDRLFVMDKWRYHAGVGALRDIAASGELGAVLGLACVRDGRGDFRDDADTIWRHLPHDLAIALEVLGDLPPARAAVAEVVDGVPVGMQAMLGARGGPWVSVAHSATAPERRRETRLCCEHGTAWLAGGYDEHVTLERGVPGAELERRPATGEMPLLAELRAFVAHLGGAPPPRSSAAEGAETVRRIGELRSLAGLS
jgi:predicted dehydrogenase